MEPLDLKRFMDWDQNYPLGNPSAEGREKNGLLPIKVVEVLDCRCVYVIFLDSLKKNKQTSQQTSQAFCMSSS